MPNDMEFTKLRRFRIFIQVLLFASIELLTSASIANTLLPLTSWIATRKNLTFEESAYLGKRCFVAFSINKNILETFVVDFDSTKLNERVNVNLWVYSRFSATNKAKLSKKELDKSLKNEINLTNELFESYYEALKHNQPIPYSLYNELLATDIGVCNSNYEEFLRAYKLMNEFENKKKML